MQRKLTKSWRLACRMTDFGAGFRKARESSGISIDQIAIETRISSRFLKAIEDEKFHLLPGGIFNRGFVRAYADCLGLDAERAVADYERVAAFSQSSEPLNTAVSPPSQPKSRRHLYLVLLGALALLFVVLYIVTRNSGSTTHSANPQPAAASQLVTPRAPEPQAEQPSPPPSDAVPTVDPLRAESPSPPDALTLELEASEQTWIKITADGNALVPGEILIPGTTRKFTAQNSISITVGNAGGLMMKLNGQQLKSLGRSGLVRQLTITPENLKDIVS